MQTLNLLDPFSSGSAIYPEQKPEDYYEDIVHPLLWHLHPCSSVFQKKHKTDIWIAQKDALGKLLFTFFGNRSISAPRFDWTSWQLTPLGRHQLDTIDESRTMFITELYKNLVMHNVFQKSQQTVTRLLIPVFLLLTVVPSLVLSISAINVLGITRREAK